MLLWFTDSLLLIVEAVKCQVLLSVEKKGVKLFAFYSMLVKASIRDTLGTTPNACVERSVGEMNSS